MGWFRRWLWLTLVAALVPMRSDAGWQDGAVPILLYHRFGPIARDAMTVRTSVFATQLAYLRNHGYRVIPLAEVVAYVRGIGPPPPPRSVAITADDGHRSVYTDLFPLIRKYRVPVTLFIYPSAISNASYALTWNEIRTMHDSGLVDVQSHTYWHPNFKIEKRRLSPRQYETFVAMQLTKSKATIERELGIQVDMLAWPYGIDDPDLIRDAQAAGYVAAFTMVRAPASRADDAMTLPRYLVTDGDTGAAFGKLLAVASEARK